MVAWFALAVALLCLLLIVFQAVLCLLLVRRLRPMLGLAQAQQLYSTTMN